MLAPVAHILPLTTVRRERLLPLPGRITVREGQKVNPLDVVGEANYSEEHQLIDIGRQLELPASAAQKLVQVKAGDMVQKGDVIARQGGLVPQVIKAAAGGRVLVVGNGQVLLEIGENTFELQAGLPGTVSQIINDRGVEITFNGAMVQGVWGNGGLDVGLLLPILSAADETLIPSKLDVSLRGSIILCGYCGEPAALRAASELPVRGLILGGMSPALIPQALQARFPIILVDGFCKRPLNSMAYKLLTSSGKREATLNAIPLDRQSGARPEIFIPLPVSQDLPLPREVETFAPEQPVIITRNPHAGQVATLVSLKPGQTLMPSGLRTPAAEVRLESGEQVLVPLANLEVLG